MFLVNFFPLLQAKFRNAWQIQLFGRNFIITFVKYLVLFFNTNFIKKIYLIKYEEIL
jgi:hypothetical protein